MTINTEDNTYLDYIEEDINGIKFKTKDYTIQLMVDKNIEVQKSNRTLGNKHKDYYNKLFTSLRFSTKYLYYLDLLPNITVNDYTSYLNFRKKYNVEDTSIDYLYGVEVSICTLEDYENKSKLTLSYLRYNLNTNLKSKLKTNKVYNFSREDLKVLFSKVKSYKVEEGFNTLNQTKELVYMGTLGEVNNFIGKCVLD